MPRTARAAAGLLAAALALTGCGFHGLYNVNLPGGTNLGSHPYKVTIEFRDVLDLVPQSNVKVDDVAVGKVTSIKLDGWIAKVTVQVNGKVKLPANARAAVQMTSLLGEKYVDLEQPLALPEGTLGNGSVIPLSNTDTAPEVEEVLGALSLVLNGGGLEQIHTIATELNKALTGNSASVRDLLNQLNTFVGGLDQQKDQITTALDSIDKLSATLNDNRKILGEALDTFPQALEILKDDRSKFTQLLSSLSNLGSVATQVILASQTNLVNSLKELSPVLDSLTAAGTDLPNALKLLLTYPFPVGKTLDIVKGDYANLNAFLDLNLNENLCGISPILCGLTKTPGSSSQSTSSQTTSTGTSSQTSSEQQLPAIPGVSG
jgi:phospholipid/cholesterol/gamma-HCH transport system substrate-binding protein